MRHYKYVIIGGGVAGGKASESIRQIDPGGAIALVTQENHPPYQRPPLSKAYLRGGIGLEGVYLRDPGYYQEQAIELIQGVRAISLTPGEREVLLEDGRILRYEKLLLATGGRPRRLSIPGSELDGVFTLRTITDSQAIHQASAGGKRALVMGGSFMGSEVAASLSQAGAEVSLIFPGERLLERVVPEEVSQMIHSLFRKHGVRLIPGTVAHRLEGDSQVRKAVLDSGESLAVDLVVMGVGIQLNTELAQEAGLQVQQPDNAIMVDQTLRTSDPHIYVAGDIAAWPDATFGKRLRVEHWDVARRQGMQAGRNMAGKGEAYHALPYFYSDLFDLRIEAWGNLSAWERTVTRGSPESGSFALFYAAQNRLVGVLTVNRPGGERRAMQALVKSQPVFDEITKLLQDEKGDLTMMKNMQANMGTGGGSEKLSFAVDIRPFFRKKDIDEMKDVSDFDLSKYEDVRQWASQIYSRLADGSMPCDNEWPEEQLALFKQWMDEGMEP